MENYFFSFNAAGSGSAHAHASNMNSNQEDQSPSSSRFKTFDFRPYDTTPSPRKSKRSCDLCKLKKRKCNLTELRALGLTHKCDACERLGVDCRTDVPPKRRGPRPKYFVHTNDFTQSYDTPVPVSSAGSSSYSRSPVLSADSPGAAGVQSLTQPVVNLDESMLEWIQTSSIESYHHDE